MFAFLAQQRCCPSLSTYSCLPHHLTDAEIDQFKPIGFAITVFLVEARLHKLSNRVIDFYLARFGFGLKMVTTYCPRMFWCRC